MKADNLFFSIVFFTLLTTSYGCEAENEFSDNKPEMISMTDEQEPKESIFYHEMAKKIVKSKRLNELNHDTENYITQKKNQALNTAGKAVDEVFDYAVKSVRGIAINWVRKTLREYLSPFLRAN